jgi:hypothetical protein
MCPHHNHGQIHDTPCHLININISKNYILSSLSRKMFRELNLVGKNIVLYMYGAEVRIMNIHLSFRLTKMGQTIILIIRSVTYCIS